MSISMEFHGSGNSLMESLDQLVDQLVDRKTLLFYQPIPYITTKKIKNTDASTKSYHQQIRTKLQC